MNEIHLVKHIIYYSDMCTQTSSEVHMISNDTFAETGILQIPAPHYNAERSCG